MKMPASLSLESTVSHLFRHQSGRLVSVLSRIFGVHNIELAEDVVQDTLLAALEQWKLKGIPDSPEDWLFVVAKNKALNLIKKQWAVVYFGDEETNPLLQSGYTIEHTFNQLLDKQYIADDQLRMMFACCNEGLNDETQVTLMLKMLCGFSVAEIARAFLTNSETIAKRLYRARQAFKEGRIKLAIPAGAQMEGAFQTVLKAIYLLLNEGYNAAQHEDLIRKDLMEEAYRLCCLLRDNENTDRPEVQALQALICFHASRVDARVNDEGMMLLLKDQDRSLWNKELLERGLQHLSASASGGISVYHLEAGIASVHCLAPSYEETNWASILQYYELLERLDRSPVIALNKAIAVTHTSGTEDGIAALDALKDEAYLQGYYLYHAVYAEWLTEKEDYAEAARRYELAISLTQSPKEVTLLKAKLAALPNKLKAL